jgi:hypothetical protein
MLLQLMPIIYWNVAKNEDNLRNEAPQQRKVNRCPKMENVSVIMICGFIEKIYHFVNSKG